MTGVQDNLKKRQEEREQKKREYEERKAKREAEKERRRLEEEERKRKEEERKQRAIEKKAAMEAEEKDKEIELLRQYNSNIEDHSVGSNPLFEQIELCEYLSNYCQKRLNSNQN